MKIVLTGGPAAGKTSIVDIIHRMDWSRMNVVPEAASILFRGGFPRSPDPVHIHCQQRAIYAVQKELEEIGALEATGRAVICDRGTLDGLAYWPGTEQDFFETVGTTMEKELKRYDWVLHLDTASPLNYKNTTIRTESSDQANVINEKVKHAWRLHPQRIIIPNNSDFFHKVKFSLEVVSLILDHVPLTAINEKMKKFEC